MRFDLPSLIDFRRLRDDRTGAVGIMFGLMAVPCLFAVGAAVDLTRAAQFKTTLQAAVDSAALAGAGAYSDAATAQSVANKYMNAALAYLPSNVAVNFTATASTVTTNGKIGAYTVTVTATGTVKSSFMSIAIPTLTIGATATAEDPVMSATADFTGFAASAGDQNTVYVYAIPSDGSLPPTASLTQIYSNSPPASPCTGPSGGVTTNISFRSNQKIGFALKNVNGGLCPYLSPSAQGGPSTGPYGQTDGSTHYFYSQLMPPSAAAYPSVTQNCSLATAVQIGATPPSKPAPGCFSSLPQYATVTCAQIVGMQIRYFWNDMGGTTDDKDYNDAQYTFACSSATSGVSASQVVLIK